ncbi:PIN domain-containing protein [Candidatus Electronema sp. PJ]|uniref:PIN domain-containing protein n=1 Tax=Candidatus Electronema sp. PJ TaxID=3401572 RepID=UPI003AA9DD6A
MKIYLDTCCLNRPFDDQSNLRVRLESEAVKMILLLCEQKQCCLISSKIAEFEIANTPDEAKRSKLKFISGLAEQIIEIDARIALRAKEFEKTGMQAFDSLHLACAETSADVFLTVDDKFLKLALKVEDLKVQARNPVQWLSEVLV